MVNLTYYYCVLLFFRVAYSEDCQEYEDIEKNICNDLFVKDVVEGESTYVNIICPFDKKDEPVYWKINQKLYHTSNLPYIFKSTVYGVLTLETINRRMNHWEIQCIRVDSNKELMRGERTVLRVLYDATAPDPGTSSSLEPSNRGRIIVNYQDMNIGVNETFLNWFYLPDYASPCAESRYYELGLYSRTGSGDLQSIDESIDSMIQEESITIDSTNLYSSNDDTLIYFNVSALATNSSESCATTEYLQTISGLDHKVIYANGNSTSFEIPAEFNGSSLQLIWPTEYTQCVSPMVEELIDLSFCNGKNNTLSLFNNTITISNLEGMDYLAVYVVNSTLISCCNIRTIERVYRIFLEGGGPEELRLSYDREERAICVFYNYNSSSDPIYPIGYQASITALTDHIWTSKKRNTPQCIDIPTKFYHNVLCNSFNLTLSLTDFFEEELQRKQLEINLDKITVMVDSSSITANSTNVTLHCYFSEYNSDSSGLSLTLMQEKTVLQNMSLAHCNITKPLEDLQSGTNYTLIVNRNFNYEDYTTSCELYRGQFKTKDKDNGTLQTWHIVLITVAGILILAVVVLILAVIVKRFRRSGNDDDDDNKIQNSP